MFQTFEEISDNRASRSRLAALRKALRAARLDGFFVPRTDEFQSEYVPACAERLRWLTGFSGSAGLAIVLARKAALFVDGRYVLQAREQVIESLFTVCQTPPEDPLLWLGQQVRPGARIGYDPRLHTMKSVTRMARVLKAAEAELVPVAENPIDALWDDRPAPPMAPIEAHPLRYAGETARKKIARIRQAVAEAGADAAVITAPESVAWLLNIRGGDLLHTPVPLCRLILHPKRQPELFLDRRKVPDSLREPLSRLVQLRKPTELRRRLGSLGKKGVRVLVDPSQCSDWIASRLRETGAHIVEGSDPCLLPKAIKNAKEIRGARAAHLRDGVAMVRFLAWLSRQDVTELDEIRCAEQLEAFRRETGELRDISFDTISAAGPHGAIVHYRVSRKSNRPLSEGSLYLVDSGGQYADGTTDVTRTLAIGTPTAAMQRHYTLVLKGHIALATARFPAGTRGCDLDVLARQPLWMAGLDYDHGTGHGVGSYLSVHEGPQAISKRGTAELVPGMILSNEPGYYREGAYGIRIENLLLVTEAEVPPEGERPMLGFETLTLVPLDRQLIVTDLLSAEEIAWVNAYHGRIYRSLSRRLSKEDRQWLKTATQPL